MNIVHGFDFMKLKTELKLNFYQQVIFNYQYIFLIVPDPR